LIKKYYLLSPGPTPIPDKVQSVAAQPIIHHRSKNFSNILKEVMEDLKYVFQTRQMELNYNFKPGQSLSAAQIILKENWS